MPLGKRHLPETSHPEGPAKKMCRIACALLAILLSWPTVWPNHAAGADGDLIDLKKDTVVIRSGELPNAEKITPVILSEEIARRTGVRLSVTDRWPANARCVIALSVRSSSPSWKSQIPAALPAGGGKPGG